MSRLLVRLVRSVLSRGEEKEEVEEEEKATQIADGVGLDRAEIKYLPSKRIGRNHRERVVVIR